MTSKFSIDNRDLLQRISSGEAVVGIDFGNLIVRELSAFRLAAMDSSESVELPLDYLQGHKDGLEWAARLAEANHPDTGDWLYDDPIELAKAIRKGPDMPPSQPAPVVPENCLTAEHRRVIEMLLSVCGAAFELADDSCQQDVDGEDCHVVPDDAFQKLSDALDEIENTLPTEDIDRPDVFLAWSAMPRAALKSLLQAQPAPDYFASLVAAARVRADKAIRKFPQPNYVLNKVAEESGEVIKAVIHYTEGREEWSNVEAEIIDNLAMLLRLVKEGDQVIGFTPPVSCRAAMLAAAPHDTPALNSVQNVVTVPGKWIPVSERMPEDEQEVLTINKMGHRFVSFFDKHSGLFFDRLDAPAACCIEHVLVTHWMPLPAAPQEVKGE